jgi:hypothetical protein
VVMRFSVFFLRVTSWMMPMKCLPSRSTEVR